MLKYNFRAEHLFSFLADHKIRQREKMYKEMLRPYKFYLSFENTNCQDYITETFFAALRTEEVIPIALGGLSINDYAAAAPAHSYIHTGQYSSVSALAQKLDYLSQNDTAFNEYFWWTEYYRVTSLWEHYVSAQCDLCGKINLVLNKGLALPPTNLYDFLSAEKTCNYNNSKSF